ncbi:LLM class flavin-dependent oxidoreductase [Streptomyces sp. NPDC006739]|uniref:LLM class flavin-dependent oxidoreductase n=1 Tax=Streptomyces sp. NPDC006739 TaxID=3364763 RepID=UPI0036BFEC8E
MGPVRALLLLTTRSPAPSQRPGPRPRRPGRSLSPPVRLPETTVELGIISLSDLQTDPATGKPHDSGRRTREIVSYAVAAVQAGLDVFGLGEHHSRDFAVANPAVPLAAIAQATARIRLASAVSVLSTADPVRLHQDFASLDLISEGRTEIIAGRSAFVEAFRLFGVGLEDYDDVFAEKLRLLLARWTAKPSLVAPLLFRDQPAS